MRSRTPAGPSTRARAAASSIASGRPSRRPTSAATSAPSGPSRPIARPCAAARSAYSRAASPPGPRLSGPTGTSCSPRTRVASREVATKTACGQLSSQRARSGAATSTSCSRLSRMTRQGPRAAMASPMTRTGSPLTPVMPRPDATEAAKWSAVRAAARSQNQAPPDQSPSQDRANLTTRRVLPAPPGPTTVIRRWAASTARSSAPSASLRPTNASRSAGSECGTSRAGRHPEPSCTTLQTFPPSAGGSLPGGAPSSKSAMGSDRPFNRQCPLGTRSAGLSRSATAATSVSSVRPAGAIDITRAASGLAWPSTSTGLAPCATCADGLSRSTTSPTWRPALATSVTPSSAESSAREA